MARTHETLIVSCQGRPLRLAYESWGRGRPLVLLHGMGSWRKIWPRWDWPGYHLWAFDLPGFGQSGLPRRVQSLDDYGAVIRDAVEAIGLKEPPLYLAHSFGSMVAVRAVDLGAPAAGFVLVNPAGFVPPRNALKPTAFVCLNRILIWLTGSRFFGRQMARSLGMNPDAMTAQDERELQQGWRRAREMARMPSFYEYAEMVKVLTGLALPYRLLLGEQDPLFPASLIEPLVPAEHIVLMRGQGHVPMLQDPSGFTRTVERVLQDIYPGESPA